jgi:hypothetical protein
MMDSFVEAQNSLKRKRVTGSVTLFKARQSRAVRFSFIPIFLKSPGLKPIEAQNARSSSAFVPYLASMRQQRAFGPSRLLSHPGLARGSKMTFRKDQSPAKILCQKTSYSFRSNEKSVQVVSPILDDWLTVDFV